MKVITLHYHDIIIRVQVRLREDDTGTISFVKNVITTF